MCIKKECPTAGSSAGRANFFNMESERRESVDGESKYSNSDISKLTCSEGRDVCEGRAAAKGPTCGEGGTFGEGLIGEEAPTSGQGSAGGVSQGQGSGSGEGRAARGFRTAASFFDAGRQEVDTAQTSSASKVCCLNLRIIFKRALNFRVFLKVTFMAAKNVKTFLFYFYTLLNVGFCVSCCCFLKSQKSSIVTGTGMITCFCHYICLMFFMIFLISARAMSPTDSRSTRQNHLHRLQT